MNNMEGPIRILKTCNNIQSSMSYVLLNSACAEPAGAQY